MLKLNNSFCRYRRLTCENINYNNKTTPSHFTPWCYKRKTYIIWNSPLSYIGRFIYTGVQWRSIQKKFCYEKSYLNSNDTKTPTKISETMQPSLHHVSYGGEIQDSDESSSHEPTPIVKKCKTDRLPNFRKWEPVGKVNDTKESTGIKFRILSYNVLAQYLLECHPYLYTDCAPRNLKWKVRAAKIYDEIINLSPDIICLQEVQVSHLRSFYGRFEQLGYTRIFKQKTGNRQDGCAIYFKQSLFDILDHTSVEFYQPELPILNRDNIGLIVKLAPKESPTTPLIVATTHLLYNPKRTDVRLAQLQLFLAEIDRFAYDSQRKDSEHLPIIIAGDFNSTPDSAVVQLLGRGKVSAKSFRDNSDWKRIGVTDNCQHLSVYLNRQKGESSDFSMTKIQNSDYTLQDLESATSNCQGYHDLFNGGNIRHPFKFTSAYRTVKSGGELEATTFQDLWVTVDYIYFSCCSSLKLVERLRLPTATECEVLGRLPNFGYGSDHLVLAATFELKPLAKASL